MFAIVICLVLIRCTLTIWSSVLCVLIVEGMSVVLVNKQFELLELFLIPLMLTYLQYDEIYLTFTAGSVSLCWVCGHVVVFGLSVRLSWYPMWMRWLLRLWCVHCCLCCMCVCRESVVVRGWLKYKCGGWMRCGECRACGWYTWLRHCV